MKKKCEPFITMEGDRMMMYMGHPKFPCTKIDVTMAFNIGVAIGSKEYDRIDHEQVKL